MAQNEERTADDSAYSEELSAPAATAAPNVVQGTAESMISKLENSMLAPPTDPSSEEGDLLQSSEPGPLDKEGKDVEDVLGIISQVWIKLNGKKYRRDIIFRIPLPLRASTAPARVTRS